MTKVSMNKMKRCRAVLDPGGVAVGCVRRARHSGKLHMSSVTDWCDASSEEPIPSLKGKRMVWGRGVKMRYVKGK